MDRKSASGHWAPGPGICEDDEPGFARGHAFEEGACTADLKHGIETAQPMVRGRALRDLIQLLQDSGSAALMTGFVRDAGERIIFLRCMNLITMTNPPLPG